MRTIPLLLIILVAACGGSSKTSTLPNPAPAITPADDLAAAKIHAPRVDPSSGGLTARDPRVVDLDIIRIRASGGGVGGEPELTSVASADLFRQANEAAKAGTTKDAIARYRQLIAEFPESIYAPVSLFNIAAVYDGQGDLSSTITTLRELVATYPTARESIDGHLYIAALQADHKQWPEAVTTLDAALARANLTYADRIEAQARKGYVQLEQGQLDAADATLAGAIADWRKAPRIEDPYYIAMAHYYRGELMHRRFAAAPIRSGDDEMVADLEAKRVLATKAYDRWKESLGFKHAYWATASGYQMSQIFVELWEAHVNAPYPKRIELATRPTYVAEVHERVREHLEKALEGHRMNVELAKAFGVDTSWSKGSEQRAVQIMDLIAKESKGSYVTPAP
ncbi:MAG: tetratricopeptide repeat protein [Deltaproteobacteria bacterium]|nr:tetratricopeptide repeat protein [Deltaproteobacteria bacterium]